MSREAFGDPPESQEEPDLCPVCGNDWHAEDCEFGKEVARRLKAERDAHKLLRDLLTTQERGRFINAAVAAVRGSPAGCKTPFGCEERGCLGWCDEHRPDGAAAPDSKTPNARLTGAQQHEVNDE